MSRGNPSRPMSSLSPWDMSGIGMGFGLYRPRRPSYTFATQQSRQRSESYRYAVRKSTSDLEDQPDFIEGIIKQKTRKESYVRATRGRDEPFEMELRESPNSNAASMGDFNNHSRNSLHLSSFESAAEKTPFPIRNSLSLDTHHLEELKAAVAKKRSPKHSPFNSKARSNNHSPKTPTKASYANDTPLVIKANDRDEDGVDDSVFGSSLPREDQGQVTTPCSEDNTHTRAFHVFKFKKNLILLCSSFILVFSAFRAIQNLQSSINDKDNLGIIAMTCVHGTMCITCMFAPVIINQFTAKWTLAAGTFSFILWTAANFYPKFYTLIPLGIFAGIGQGILWTAESSYILKLAFDSSKVSRDELEREVFRFHGIFLACFQTTHIWGNLISSVVIQKVKGVSEEPNGGCGVLFPCTDKQPPLPLFMLDTKEPDLHSSLWKLMSAYLALGCIGFCLILLCLDKIGARVQPEKSGYEIVVQHVTMMVTHKTFRLLVPLLIFSGLQQGFVFSDFNQAYVKCAMGEEYIGYSMIILGLANVTSAITVALCAKVIPREVVFGIGGVIHMGLMIGLLIWIPDRNLAIFFILAAAWGVCDAVWQTQCNTLICLTCPEDSDVAFANYRMLQSLGLTMAFMSGTFLCVSFKLYILMTLLVLAIMFYVLAEYKVRQVDTDEFEATVQVD